VAGAAISLCDVRGTAKGPPAPGPTGWQQQRRVALFKGEPGRYSFRWASDCAEPDCSMGLRSTTTVSAALNSLVDQFRPGCFQPGNLRRLSLTTPNPTATVSSPVSSTTTQPPLSALRPLPRLPTPVVKIPFRRLTFPWRSKAGRNRQQHDYGLQSWQRPD